MKILFIITLLLLAGCKKDTAKESEKLSEQEHKTENSESGSSAVLNNGSEDKSSGDKKPIGYVNYSVSVLPEVIKYQGTIIAMAKWKDALGDNVVFVTETAESSNEDTRSKELYGYHYILNEDAGQLWRIYDFVKDCPLDLTLRYLDRSLEITDLDSNGIGESSFLYRLACKGDVSSDDLKLIMHEGKEKFAIRGIMDIYLNGKLFQKGEMNIDPSFQNAPSEFSEYSIAKWNKFKTDNIGQ